jgi:hypothetical protein
MSGHRNFSRRIAIAASSNDVRAILTLINLSLEAAPPEVAVETIRIDVEPRVPRPAQTDMFLPPAPAPDKLQTTIARLTALCGPGNVGALSAENSHRPGAMRVEPFAPPAAPPIPEASAPKNVTQLVIRTIRPAREIEVMCTRTIPEFVRGENLGARVISIAGPWRRDGEWWKNGALEPACAAAEKNSAHHAIKRNGGPPFGMHPREVTAHNLKSIAASSGAGENGATRNSSGADHKDTARDESASLRECGFIRDYYELALEDGGVYRVFRDVKSDQWFLDGSYD